VNGRIATMAEITSIVFAGGLGTRLGGVKKALLEVGGKPIIERILDAVSPLSRDVIVVDNDDSLAHLPGIRVVPDSETRAGVLTALHSGLSAAHGELCLVVACDMPFLSPSLLRRLLDLVPDFDVVMPVMGGQMEPMHAVYRRAQCLEAIGDALSRGEKRMISYLGSVRVREVAEGELREVDPELRSFFNVNTAEDLEWARAIVAS